MLAGLFAKRTVLQTPSETIEYYRQFGFFSQQSTEQILARATKEWGKEPPAGKVWDDVFLLRYDEAAARHGDPEADVCEGNEVYVSTLEAWAKITNGAFAPTDIQEEWQSERGPIEVSFLLEGRSVTIKPKYQNDWIDLAILLQLNQIIKADGKRFNCAVDGNFYLLVFLSPEAEKRLRLERGFPFALP
jgi:hypothetical protein